MALTGCRSVNTEIAGIHGRGGDERNGADRSLPNGGALITDKEEQLVLQDGAAYGAAELIALQRVARSGEEVTRVEVAIAEELKGIAMK